MPSVIFDNGRPVMVAIKNYVTSSADDGGACLIACKA